MKYKTKRCLTALALCAAAMVGVYCSEFEFNNPVDKYKIHYGSYTDKRDQKVYRTVKIGGLTWMAENLNYGAAGVCYNGSLEYCEKYGRLYTWGEADAACPKTDGWRLPDDTDWEDLIAAAGGDFDVGDRLKAASGWSYGNSTNELGFSAMPGGFVQ